jgi:uncharacterized membrane protein
MMGFGFFSVILVVLVLAYMLGWRPENLNLGNTRQGQADQTPLAIVRERYARGEITKKEFENMRADLER